jgi:squalene cyclase
MRYGAYVFRICVLLQTLGTWKGCINMAGLATIELVSQGFSHKYIKRCSFKRTVKSLHFLTQGTASMQPSGGTLCTTLTKFAFL